VVNGGQAPVEAFTGVDQAQGRSHHHAAHHPLEVVMGDPGVATLGRNDADKNLVSSELFSAGIGVGEYMNEHDYREAYREMFHQGYFGKEDG
jgi:hypothetical protein